MLPKARTCDETAAAEVEQRNRVHHFQMFAKRRLIKYGQSVQEMSSQTLPTNLHYAPIFLAHKRRNSGTLSCAFFSALRKFSVEASTTTSSEVSQHLSRFSPFVHGLVFISCKLHEHLCSWLARPSNRTCRLNKGLPVAERRSRNSKACGSCNCVSHDFFPITTYCIAPEP